MFGYLTSFVFSEKNSQSDGKHILSTLWYCKKVEHIMKIVDKMAELNKDAPVLFLQQLTEKKVETHTHKIIKEVLIKYNAPSWKVCKQVSDYLSDKTPCIASACAIAIGTEKVKWNKEFYHKIRVLKDMEMGEWRKFLKNLRSKEDYVRAKTSNDIKNHTFGLFNEPLHKTVINNSECDMPILSLYKGEFKTNKHCRSPIEISLDEPLTQKDVSKFVDKKHADEDLVIITKFVDKDVSPPKGVYVCFMDETDSFADRVYPFVDNISYSSVENFFYAVDSEVEN